MNPLIDNEIVTIMLEEKIDFICSVPCNMLAGVLNRLHTLPMTHIPVTREEEGVGIAAGAALGGENPLCSCKTRDWVTRLMPCFP